MNSITIKLLGKEYQIACPPGAEPQLQYAASYLDQKMTEVKNNGKIISFEGILITIAINLTHDLLQLNHNLEALEQKLDQTLKANTIEAIDSTELAKYSQ